MRTYIENSVYNIRVLIEMREAALSRDISDQTKTIIQKEIEILEKLLLDIEDHEIKLDALRLEEHRAILKLKDRILALESICLLHGIYDFPVWMNRGSASLFNEAIEFYQNKMIQIPYKLIGRNYQDEQR